MSGTTPGAGEGPSATPGVTELPSGRVASASADSDSAATELAFKKAQEALSEQATTNTINSVTTPELANNAAVITKEPFERKTGDQSSYSEAASKAQEALSATPLATETIQQAEKLDAKNFTEFTPDDWKNYIEANKLKTMTIGKDITLFPFPDQDGNYIAVNSLGTIQLKDDGLGTLKRAFETRLNETDLDPVSKNKRELLEKIMINNITGKLELTILEGDVNNPAPMKHIAELGITNDAISKILEANRAKVSAAAAPAAPTV